MFNDATHPRHIEHKRKLRQSQYYPDFYMKLLSHTHTSEYIIQTSTIYVGNMFPNHGFKLLQIKNTFE